MLIPDRACTGSRLADWSTWYSSSYGVFILTILAKTKQDVSFCGKILFRPIQVPSAAVYCGTSTSKEYCAINSAMVLMAVAVAQQSAGNTKVAGISSRCRLHFSPEYAYGCFYGKTFHRINNILADYTPSFCPSPYRPSPDPGLNYLPHFLK